MEVLKLKDDNPHKAEIEALNEEVQQLKTELVLCKTGIANGGILIQLAPKLDVPKPNELKGNWYAKEVDNFFWSMEQ